MPVLPRWRVYDYNTQQTADSWEPDLNGMWVKAEDALARIAELEKQLAELKEKPCTGSTN